MGHAPADEYRARLSGRRATHLTLTRSDERLSYARLAVFAAGAIILVAAWRGWLPAWWIAHPGVAFLMLVVLHDRIIRARDAAARAIGLYERGLSRIEDRWAGGGEQGERFSDAGHLYANDLDVFGPASLFELLSSARTRPAITCRAKFGPVRANGPSVTLQVSTTATAPAPTRKSMLSSPPTTPMTRKSRTLRRTSSRRKAIGERWRFALMARRAPFVTHAAASGSDFNLFCIDKAPGGIY